MFRSAEIESVNEFWEAMLKRLKAYAEAREHVPEPVIHKGPNCRVLEAADPRNTKRKKVSKDQSVQEEL
jgi:hypothetical protein